MRVRKAIGLGDGGCEFPQDLPVSEGHSSRPVYSDQVLVELPARNYYAGLVPLERLDSGLILHPDPVTYY